ncbi:MAG: 3-isopropylmalate dehydratase [Thermoprotei archaeon]|nr:MAG: 3-isopropylmalate dehydratase [Thermoprotei archaeon]RLF19931.1 MAG: 3-isopropylmalate dehydratase [Thermoprotei archaeon]
MKIRGSAWKFGDNVSTDDIIPGRFFHLRGNIEELAKHAFEDLRPDFARKVREGDIIVAGENFGIGSSREHAVLVLKALGIRAIVAKSFARIFFRNAINLGVPAVIADTTKIEEGDALEIDLEKGHITNLTKGFIVRFKPLPSLILDIIKEGGLINYILKHGFPLGGRA